MRPRMHEPVLILTLLAAQAFAGAPPEPSGQKALSPAVEKGLEWLSRQKLKSGGWGQGEESVQMGRGLTLKGVANVADTSMAVLALMRSGSTPKQGRFSVPIAQGVEFVLKEIEASDRDSLYVTKVKGTRVQGKLGPYVDTFIAATLLTEVRGKMPSPAAEERVHAALEKVMAKMKKNQQGDGRFDTAGWAPTLSQAMATRSINRAAQAGMEVDEGMREKAEAYAKGEFGANGLGAGAGSAGVQLYSAAATVSQVSESTTTNEAQAEELRAKVAAAPPSEQQEAKAKLDRFADTARVEKSARDTMTGRLKDPGFVAGFGSNGGEEFLSYMLISESLRKEGGKAWQEWDAGMAKNLARVQNADGSWTGHHCITGRSFCTAAALLVLMADRAPLAATAAG
ncbi:MAG: hypothetical protein HYZ28_05560 [Myxococcales bacterium]|nr:hypothetical protein [Myxococcales bacterium]